MNWKQTLFALSCGACLLAGGCAASKVAAEPIWNMDAIYTSVSQLKDDAGGALFDGLNRATQKELSDIYLIDSGLCRDFVMGVDKKYNFFMILRPEEGKQNDVKNSAAGALDSLSTQLELYDPEQSARVRDRLETVRGEYLIYVASPDNNAVIDAVDDAVSHNG